MNVGNKGRRLVLHFDVNKTIIMKDQLDNTPTVTMTICNILSKIAWGKIVSKKISADKEEQQWQLVFDQLQTQRPPRGQEDTEDLISFKEYLDKFYPLVKRKQIPDDAERDRLNLENETIRQNKLLNFAKPGNPGAKFKNHFEKMIKSLSLPKAAKEELRISDDAGQNVFSSKAGSQGELQNIASSEGIDKSQAELAERKETTQMSQTQLEEVEGEDKRPASIAKEKHKEEDKENDDYRNFMQIFGEGKYHIIPSFFRTLIYLKKAKKEFAIVFRTFGSDLNNVIFEFNKFCSGDHPCYNGRGGTPLVKFDGSKGTKDLSIKDKCQKALYYRYSQELNDNKLVTGTTKRTSQDDTLEEFYSGDIEEGNVNLYKDPIEQFVAILDILKKRSTMGIQDDYNFWAEQSFKKTGGKLLLIDQADYGTHQIFFDDNAEEQRIIILLIFVREELCNIDVKDVVTGENMTYKKFINKYVFRVEPHRAILEPDYFIKLIEQAEIERDQEIERIEQGLDSEDERAKEQQTENEWDKLQKLPNEEYLMKTILPVLYQGMRVVDLERPVSPLEYLALYLLKHQDQVKLPPKSQN